MISFVGMNFWIRIDSYPSANRVVLPILWIYSIDKTNCCRWKVNCLSRIHVFYEAGSIRIWYLLDCYLWFNHVYFSLRLINFMSYIFFPFILPFDLWCVVFCFHCLLQKCFILFAFSSPFSSYNHFTLLRVPHTSVNLWPSTEAWVTPSFLKFPGVFSVFWPIFKTL